MRQMVITVIGDDRAGLVEALAGAVAGVGGNWERSRMAELAGQFAGVVLVSVPEAAIAELEAALGAITDEGLLHVSIRPAGSSDDGGDTVRWRLRLVGADHTGIVHRVSRALAARGVSIDELETEVTPAPMGGTLFRAEAELEAPTSVPVEDIRDVLEQLTPDLMVDLDPNGGADPV